MSSKELAGLSLQNDNTLQKFPYLSTFKGTPSTSADQPSSQLTPSLKSNLFDGASKTPLDDKLRFQWLFQSTLGSNSKEEISSNQHYAQPSFSPIDKLITTSDDENELEFDLSPATNSRGLLGQSDNGDALNDDEDSFIDVTGLRALLSTALRDKLVLDSKLRALNIQLADLESANKVFRGQVASLNSIRQKHCNLPQISYDLFERFRLHGYRKCLDRWKHLTGDIVHRNDRTRILCNNIAKCHRHLLRSHFTKFYYHVKFCNYVDKKKFKDCQRQVLLKRSWLQFRLKFHRNKLLKCFYIGQLRWQLRTSWTHWKHYHQRSSVYLNKCQLGVIKLEACRAKRQQTVMKNLQLLRFIKVYMRHKNIVQTIRLQRLVVISRRCLFYRWAFSKWRRATIVHNNTKNRAISSIAIKYLVGSITIRKIRSHFLRWKSFCGYTTFLERQKYLKDPFKAWATLISKCKITPIIQAINAANQFCKHKLSVYFHRWNKLSVMQLIALKVQKSSHVKTLLLQSSLLTMYYLYQKLHSDVKKIAFDFLKASAIIPAINRSGFHHFYQEHMQKYRKARRHSRSSHRSKSSQKSSFREDKDIDNDDDVCVIVDSPTSHGKSHRIVSTNAAGNSTVRLKLPVKKILKSSHGLKRRKSIQLETVVEAVHEQDPLSPDKTPSCNEKKGANFNESITPATAQQILEEQQTDSTLSNTILEIETQPLSLALLDRHMGSPVIDESISATSSLLNVESNNYKQQLSPSSSYSDLFSVVSGSTATTATNFTNATGSTSTSHPAMRGPHQLTIHRMTKTFSVFFRQARLQAFHQWKLVYYFTKQVVSKRLKKMTSLRIRVQLKDAFQHWRCDWFRFKYALKSVFARVVIKFLYLRQLLNAFRHWKGKVLVRHPLCVSRLTRFCRVFSRVLRRCALSHWRTLTKQTTLAQVTRYLNKEAFYFNAWRRYNSVQRHHCHLLLAIVINKIVKAKSISFNRWRCETVHRRNLEQLKQTFQGIAIKLHRVITRHAKGKLLLAMGQWKSFLLTSYHISYREVVAFRQEKRFLQHESELLSIRNSVLNCLGKSKVVLIKHLVDKHRDRFIAWKAYNTWQLYSRRVVHWRRILNNMLQLLSVDSTKQFQTRCFHRWKVASMNMQQWRRRCVAFVENNRFTRLLRSFSRWKLRRKHRTTIARQFVDRIQSLANRQQKILLSMSRSFTIWKSICLQYQRLTHTSLHQHFNSWRFEVIQNTLLKSKLRSVSSIVLKCRCSDHFRSIASSFQTWKRLILQSCKTRTLLLVVKKLACHLLRPFFHRLKFHCACQSLMATLRTTQTQRACSVFMKYYQRNARLLFYRRYFRRWSSISVSSHYNQLHSFLQSLHQRRIKRRRFSQWLLGQNNEEQSSIVSGSLFKALSIAGNSPLTSLRSGPAVMGLEQSQRAVTQMWTSWSNDSDDVQRVVHLATSAIHVISGLFAATIYYRCNFGVFRRINLRDEASADCDTSTLKPLYLLGEGIVGRCASDGVARCLALKNQVTTAGTAETATDGIQLAVCPIYSRETGLVVAVLELRSLTSRDLDTLDILLHCEDLLSNRPLGGILKGLFPAREAANTPHQREVPLAHTTDDNKADSISRYRNLQCLKLFSVLKMDIFQITLIVSIMNNLADILQQSITDSKEESRRSLLSRYSQAEARRLQLESIVVDVERKQEDRLVNINNHVAALDAKLSEANADKAKYHQALKLKRKENDTLSDQIHVQKEELARLMGECSDLKRRLLNQNDLTRVMELASSTLRDSSVPPHHDIDDDIDLNTLMFGEHQFYRM